MLGPNGREKPLLASSCTVQDMPNLQPAVKKLYFAYTSGSGTNETPSGYIDLSLAASIVNRRFYRQGLNWAVANVNITFPDGISSSDSKVFVETLHDTWITANAWKKSFALWQKMNKWAMNEVPSVKPKFYDYKIHMDEGMYNDWSYNVNNGGQGYQSAAEPYVGILAPRTDPAVGPANFILGGEWDYARFIIPKADDTADVDDFKVWMIGDSTADGKGIIKGYGQSRALITSPDPTVPATLNQNWMSDVMNQGTDQTEAILEDLEDYNDETPYTRDYYAGGTTNWPVPQLVGYSVFTTANETGQQVQLNTGPFNAQCGLIRIDTQSVESKIVLIEVTLVPGHNRGYLTQPMGDVQ